MSCFNDENVIVEATHLPPSGWVFRLLSNGRLYRKYKDFEWELAWVVPPSNVPLEAELIKTSSLMDVVIDNTNKLQHFHPKPAKSAKNIAVAKTAKAKPTKSNQSRKDTMKSQKEKPMRIGAKATKFLDSLNLPENSRNELAQKAAEIAAKYNDNILRDYYLYMALGQEMPSDVQKRWQYFQEHGKEMGGSVGTGGSRKKAVEPTENGSQAEEPAGVEDDIPF